MRGEERLSFPVVTPLRRKSTSGTRHVNVRQCDNGRVLNTRRLTLTKWMLSDCTVLIASVRPCRNALVIAGSYVHSILPDTKVKCIYKRCETGRTIKPKISGL